jgi:hypothetical protein
MICNSLLNNVTDPDSLCAHVLKGRYILDCNAWDAPKPRSSSFTWRSICSDMQLVKGGIRWSVGDGRRIKMLADNWIPDARPGSFRTLTPIPDDTIVDFLLNDDHRAWDVDIVRSVFEEEIDCKRI